MCQPGKPAPQGLFQRMMCCGAAFFQRAILLFFQLAAVVAGTCFQVLYYPAAQLAVAVFLVVALHIKIYRAVCLVGKAVLLYFFDHFYLLGNVAGSPWFYAWWQAVKGFQSLVVAMGIALCYLHRLQLLGFGLFSQLVIAFVCIIFQVAHIGYVAHVAHFVATVGKVTEQQVESDCRAGMAQVRVAIYCRAAHVHAHKR